MRRPPSCGRSSIIGKGRCGDWNQAEFLLRAAIDLARRLCFLGAALASDDGGPNRRHGCFGALGSTDDGHENRYFRNCASGESTSVGVAAASDCR